MFVGKYVYETIALYFGTVLVDLFTWCFILNGTFLVSEEEWMTVTRMFWRFALT